VNPNVADLNGITPLHLSLKLSYDFALVELLLDHGADANMGDNLIGRSPLHIAVEERHMDAARLLLQRGASVNAQGGLDGRTPLFDAVLGGNSSMISMLLENDADVLVRDKKGLSPISTAKVMAISDVLRLLLQAFPGTMDLLDESSATQSIRRDHTGLEDGMSALGVGINHLCGACSKLQLPQSPQ
jgi:hypothetical protein